MAKRLATVPTPPAGLARKGDKLVGVDQPITRFALRDPTVLAMEKSVAQATLTKKLDEVARNRYELWDSKWFVVRNVIAGIEYANLHRAVLVRPHAEERRLKEVDGLDERDHEDKRRSGG